MGCNIKLKLTNVEQLNLVTVLTQKATHRLGWFHRDYDNRQSPTVCLLDGDDRPNVILRGDSRSILDIDLDVGYLVNRSLKFALDILHNIGRNTSLP